MPDTLTAALRWQVAMWLMDRAQRAARRAALALSEGDRMAAALDQGEVAGLYAAASALRAGESLDVMRDVNMLVTVNTDEKYGVGLRRRLAEAGISASALARESGISHAQVSRWMNGHLEPSLKSLGKLEEAFARLVERAKSGG